MNLRKRKRRKPYNRLDYSCKKLERIYKRRDNYKIRKFDKEQAKEKRK